jgi:choline dehydrogenase-like flavoprotein
MLERRADLIVIGSGAGGGTVAKELARLCRDGRRVLVLESGPKLRDDEFTGREVEMAQRLYVDSGGFLTDDSTMTIAFGRGYGGSTVVYTGTSLTMTEPTVRKWAVPGLTHDDVLRRSRKYLAENHVHLLGAEEINDNNRLFELGCRAQGYRGEQFPLNLRGCRGAGLCNLGCPNGAKMGTHRVQLPDAERLGAEVVTNCHVDRLEDRAVVATVSAQDVGEPSAWPPGEYRIHANAVIVAGGAIGSPALLLRSPVTAGLPAVGRYFTCHPALILVAQHDRPITNYAGHPKSYYCDHFAESDGFLLETCMYFPFTTAKSLTGFGDEHARMMSAMDRLQMILVLAIDPPLAENRVLVDRDGTPVVEYRFTDEVRRSLVSAMRASARIFFAAGAARVHAPAATSFFIEARDRDRIDALVPFEGFVPGKVTVSSAHPMGGCRMGAGPADSVTDGWGRVHGLPWLRVADASLFPRCAEINPYVTVMALADRVADGVRADLPDLTRQLP